MTQRPKPSPNPDAGRRGTAANDRPAIKPTNNVERRGAGQASTPRPGDGRKAR